MNFFQTLKSSEDEKVSVLIFSFNILMIVNSEHFKTKIAFNQDIWVYEGHEHKNYISKKNSELS